MDSTDEASKNMNTETPRTNAEEKYICAGKWPGITFECVTVEFAQALERELRERNNQPKPSAAEIAAENSSVAEYVASLESRLAQSKKLYELTLANEMKWMGKWQEEKDEVALKSAALSGLQKQRDEWHDEYIKSRDDRRVLESDMWRLRECVRLERIGLTLATLDENIVDAAIAIIKERGEQIDKMEELIREMPST